MILMCALITNNTAIQGGDATISDEIEGEENKKPDGDGAGANRDAKEECTTGEATRRWRSWCEKRRVRRRHDGRGRPSRVELF